MQSILDALSAAPKESLALLSGLLAATVALAVAIFTQLVLGRREMVKLLTQKLEELYLCSVDWEEEINAIETELEWFSRNSKIGKEDLKSLLERQTHKRSVKLIAMYIELYFKPLHRYSMQCWDANKHFEMILKTLSKSEAVSMREIKQATYNMLKVLGPLRSEITFNRLHLTRGKLVRPRYQTVPWPGS